MNKTMVIASVLVIGLLLFIVFSDSTDFKSPEIGVDADWKNREFKITYHKIKYSFIAPSENTNGVYLNTNAIQTLGYRVLNDGELIEIFFNDIAGNLKSIYANFLTKQFQPEYQPILTIPNPQ